jgi:hypothetical protein
MATHGAKLTAVVTIAVLVGAMSVHTSAAEQATPTAVPNPRQVIATDAGRLKDAAQQMEAMAADMINAAAFLKGAAIRTGDTDLDGLANHFIFHGDELYFRGRALEASADALTLYGHHSAAVDVSSLRSNGEQLEELGGYLVDHATEMAQQVEQIRPKGVVDPALADRLAAEAKDMADFGGQIRTMGQQMEADARSLGRSLGEEEGSE